MIIKLGLQKIKIYRERIMILIMRVQEMGETKNFGKLIMFLIKVLMGVREKVKRIENNLIKQGKFNKIIMFFKRFNRRFFILNVNKQV